MNSDEIAFEKLKVMVEAAKKLREMVRIKSHSDVKLTIRRKVIS